jgi:hypothetical protein
MAYLMSTHRTLVGVDAGSRLVQLAEYPAVSPQFLSVQSTAQGSVVEDGPLRGFRVELMREGAAFVKDGKYLSALADGRSVAVNREKRASWETFALIPEDRIADYLTRPGGDARRFGERVRALNAAGKPVRLYCGAGRIHRPGFLHLDKYLISPNFYLTNFDEYFIFPFVDLAWELPDDSVDYVFHEDFIEHVTQLMQIQFLAETLRVLKPGCWHRVNTPNLLAAMKRHSNFKEGFRGVYTGEPKHGHIALFSPFSLKEIAELVGYREIVFTTRNHGVSPHACIDSRPGTDRDDVTGNIFADLLK